LGNSQQYFAVQLPEQRDARAVQVLPAEGAKQRLWPKVRGVTFLFVRPASRIEEEQEAYRQLGRAEFVKQPI
jgi:hypothetical protein